MLALCVRPATKMAFGEARETMLWFTPSTQVVEKTVLRFGRHTKDWFEQAPAPGGDGEVLVIQIDRKACPPPPLETLGERARGAARA